MAKDTTGLLPQKRHMSLPSWFSRILPSHRPEQGGTARSHDIHSDSTSAYLDMGVNPNDLTGWNLAREQTPKLHASKTSAENSSREAQRRNMQRGRRGPALDDAGPIQAVRSPLQTTSLDLPRPPRRPSPKPRPQHQQTQSITGPEISTLLRAKEDIRRLRRDLKESGDWLGVQGADPYSGEFAVLTPTSTISTDSTPPSSKERLAELTRQQETAKLSYKQAKLEVARARERSLLRKERLRLEKMELAKDERRRQQHQFPTWTQHEQRWLSAAEPDLSPIPQSTKSYQGENSSGEDVAIATANVVRPSMSGGDAGRPKLVETPGKSAHTKLPKRDRRVNRSTDTIVRKPLPNIPTTESINTTTKSTRDVNLPAPTSADDTPHQEQKNEKNFLWRRRRRVTDPGKLIKRRHFLMSHPLAGAAERSLPLIPIGQPPPVPRLQPCREFRDHFSDLLIPDHRLHLVPYPEEMEGPERVVVPMKCDPLSALRTTPIKNGQKDIRIRPALRVLTNHMDSQESPTNPWIAVPDTKQATAKSSQSRLRRNTQLPLIHQRGIPIRNSSFRATQAWVQPQTQKNGQTRGHAETSLFEDTLSQVILQESILPEISTIKPSESLEGQIDGNLNRKPQRDLARSASTLTITITGCEANRPLLLDRGQLHMEAQKDGETDVKSNPVVPVMPGFRGDGQLACDALITEQQRDTTECSRPNMLPSDSESSVLARATPKVDTPSTKLAPLEAGSMVQATMYPLQQHDVQDTQKIQSEKSRTNEVSLSRQRGNGVRAAHLDPAPREHEETMIHEVARIEIRRSRAKEIATRKSRTPSLQTQDFRETIPAVLPGYDTTIPQESSTGGDAVSAELSLIRLGSIGLRDLSLSKVLAMQRKNPRQVQGRDGEANSYGKDDGEDGTGEDYNGDPPGAIVTLVSVLITAYMAVFGLARVWWTTIQPAFDQGGELWRRSRRLRKSTWGNIVVFLAACGFGVVVAELFVGGIGTGWWDSVQV